MTKYVLGLIALALALVGSGCNENTSAKSDETVCVFDGSNRGSQKLKYQILPGQEPKKADDDDEIVRIPVNARFWMVSADRNIADAGTPTHYVGYAKGNTEVHVEGQLRFRFNVDRACEWYAKHGRRNADNGDLGFNARGQITPWIQFGNENFVPVMGQTIKSESEPFSWQELVYGNDPAAPKREEPVDVAYGKHVGRIYTQRIEQSLGGQFFCGTDVSIWGDDENVDPDCPPIYFESLRVEPANLALKTGRDQAEALRTSAANEAEQVRIRRGALRDRLANERLQQELLKEKRQTALLQAQNDPATAKCIVFAQNGLDCDGHSLKAPIFVTRSGG